MSYYARFKDLSDKNLIHRIENKEKYQKVAVLIAFKILKERGYELEDPYPGEEIEDFTLSDDQDRNASIKVKVKAFVRSFEKESLVKVLLFLMLFYLVVYLNNFYIVGSEVVRSFHIMVNTIIARGTISSIIDFSFYGLFFLLSYKARHQLTELTWSKAFVAIKVFLFSLAALTFFEIVFRDHITIVNIFRDNTPLSFTRNTIRVIVIGISEEIVFKWLLLVQLLKRVELNDGNRVSMYLIVSILFALAHIPTQLVDHGHIRYFHLFQTFTFSYFTCTLFIRHQNFLLVVLLHILCDLPIVFLDESASKLFSTSLFLIPLYSIPFVSRSWLFEPIKNNSVVPLKKLAYAMVVSVVIVLFLPKSEYDYYYIGNENYRMQRDSIALTNASLAIEKWGKDKRSFNLRGNIYYDLGEYKKALEDYEKALEIDSNFLGAIRNKGYALRQLNDYQGCFNALTTVIDENYIRVRTYYERGDCLFRLKRFEEAEEDLLKVVEADPNHIRGLYTLSRIYFSTAEYEKALTYIDKSLELDPDYIKAVELKSMIFAGMGKYEDSIDTMTEAINLGSDNIVRFFVRGVAYYNLRQFDKAIQEFRKSEEYLNADDRLYLFWAYSLFELGKNTEGCKILRKSADLGNQEATVSISEYCYQL